MSLILTKISETATKITLGWTPVPGAIGYRFQSAESLKWSHTWDSSRSSVQFSKAAWYKVEALGVAAAGQYPPSDPPPPSELPIWNADLSTGDLSQYGGWEYGGTFDGTPPLSERVLVATSIDGFEPAQGDYLMRIRCAPGDDYGGSTGWRCVTRLPPERTNGGQIVKYTEGMDTSYTWAQLIPSGYPGDSGVWQAGPEWHGPGNVPAPHHFMTRGSDIFVDVYGGVGTDEGKTTELRASFLQGYAKGVWYVFTCRYKHSAIGSGHFELWWGRKGVDIQMRREFFLPNIKTMFNTGSNYMLFGLYRPKTGAGTLTYYVGGWREYHTLDSALAWARKILAG